jgi:hypothetical protein
MNPTQQSSKIKKLTKQKIVTIILIAIMIGIVVFLSFEGGQIYGISAGQSAGQTYVWNQIQTYENQLRDLYSNSTRAQLKTWLPDIPMNFTDGLIWESKLISYNEDRPLYQNVTQVLKNGKGACGEFVWVFGAFCAAKDIPFRMVTVGYFVPNVVDHAWAQVNPSYDGKNWIPLDVTDSCFGLAHGKTIDQLWNDTINNDSYFYKSHFKMVLAYQLGESGETTITDVTSTFSQP